MVEQSNNPYAWITALDEMDKGDQTSSEYLSHLRSYFSETELPEYRAAEAEMMLADEGTEREVAARYFRGEAGLTYVETRLGRLSVQDQLTAVASLSSAQKGAAYILGKKLLKSGSES